jgi:predicted RecB family endonuclease
MNKEELIKKIQDLTISDVRKEQVMGIIHAGELNGDSMDQIKSIIQEDIDESVSELLSEDQKKEISDVEKEGNDEIKAIATEVVEDVKFVEEQMADLTNMVNSLTPTLDEIQVDAVKAGLSQE